MAEEAARLEPPGSEEDGEQKLGTTSVSAEDSSLPPAPDVTYDATILESQNGEQQGPEIGSPEIAQWEREGGQDAETAVQESAIGSSASQEKTVGLEEGGREQRGERTEGDGKSEDDNNGRGEKEEWMDILGSGELKKKVLHPGGGVKMWPTPQCRVKIRTKGQLENGTVVDKYHSVPFTLGDGDVIQAWDLTVSLMEAGEVALVKTSPRFAYGGQGRSPDIPADASITYELELLDVQEPLDFSKVTVKDLTTLIDRKRIRGNELFQRKEFQLAINSYDKALKLVESYTTERGAVAVSSAISDMHVRCLNNLAAAYLKVELYKESQDACQKVLERDSENVKALFRYGKVLAVQGELRPAVKYLQKALKLNPHERAIQVELQKALKKKERVEKEEREMYQRMVKGVSPTEGETGAKIKKTKSRVDKWGPLPYLAVAGLVAAIGISLAYFFTQRQN